MNFSLSRLIGFVLYIISDFEDFGNLSKEKKKKKIDFFCCYKSTLTGLRTPPALLLAAALVMAAAAAAAAGAVATVAGDDVTAPMVVWLLVGDDPLVMGADPGGGPVAGAAIVERVESSPTPLVLRLTVTLMAPMVLSPTARRSIQFHTISFLTPPIELGSFFCCCCVLGFRVFWFLFNLRRNSMKSGTAREVVGGLCLV